MIDRTGESARRFGFYCCLASSLCYTLTFFLVRCLAGRINPDWTLYVKESVTVIVTFPIILALALRRKYSWPSLTVVGWILLAGFFCEFFGARLRIWSYAVLGLVLANPIIQISTILETMLLGALFLRESISPRKWGAFTVLTAAIVLIAASRTGMDPLLKNSFLTSHIGWGVALALLTGLGHTLFYVNMRKVSRIEGGENQDGNQKSQPVPRTLSMFLICLVGVLTGAGFLTAEEGPSAVVTAPPLCWLLGISAGVAGMAAFLLLNLGLRYASASKVTMIAVSQLVLLALLGRFALHEPTNGFVWVGLALACFGIILTIDVD